MSGLSGPYVAKLQRMAQRLVLTENTLAEAMELLKQVVNTNTYMAAESRRRYHELCKEFEGRKTVGTRRSTAGQRSPKP